MCTAKGADCLWSSCRSVTAALYHLRSAAAIDHRLRQSFAIPAVCECNSCRQACITSGPSKSHSVSSLISDKPSSRQASLLLQGEGGQWALQTDSCYASCLLKMPEQGDLKQIFFFPLLCVLGGGGLYRYGTAWPAHETALRTTSKLFLFQITLFSLIRGIHWFKRQQHHMRITPTLPSPRPPGDGTSSFYARLSTSKIYSGKSHLRGCAGIKNTLLTGEDQLLTQSPNSGHAPPRPVQPIRKKKKKKTSLLYMDYFVNGGGII